MHRPPPLTIEPELLINENTNEDHRAHHGEVEGRGDAEEVHEILKHLKQDGAEDDADDRPFSTAKREAAKYGRGYRVELIEVRVSGGLNRVGCTLQRRWPRGRSGPRELHTPRQ